MNEEKITEVLIDLGLSFLEAKVYLGLIKLKCEPVTAKAVSDTAGVVRQDTYRVLSDLHTRGIVEKVVGNPTMFKCIPLKVGISKLLKDRTHEYLAVKKKSQLALKSFKIEDQNYEPESLHFSTTGNTDLLIQKMRNEIKTTESIIEMIYAPERMSVIAFYLLEDLEQALERGVQVNLLTTRTTGGELNKSLKALHKTESLFEHLHMRFLEKFPGVGLAIFDRNRCYIRIAQTLGHSLFTVNNNIAGLAGYYFNSLWESCPDR